MREEKVPNQTHAIPSEWLWHEPRDYREQAETCGGREAFLRVKLVTEGSRKAVQAGVLSRKERIRRRPMLRCWLALPGNGRQQLLARGEAGEATPSLHSLTPPPPLIQQNPRRTSDPVQPLQSPVSPCQGPENLKERSGLPHICPRG